MALNREAILHEIRARLIGLDPVYTTERVVQALSLLVCTHHREKRLENIQRGVQNHVPKTPFRFAAEPLNELVLIGRAGEEGIIQLHILLNIATEVDAMFKPTAEERVSAKLSRASEAVQAYRKRVRLFLSIDYLKNGVRRSAQEAKKLFADQSHEWRRQFEEAYLIAGTTDRKGFMRDFYNNIDKELAEEHGKLLHEYQERKKKG